MIKVTIGNNVGEAVVTTVLFDNEYELLHDRIDVQAVAPLADKDYTVRGSTALLDAVGRAIHKIRKAQKATAEDYRAERVMVVIITDGEENASRNFTAEQVKALVERQREKHGWEFVFISANMDAVMEAGRIGIAADRAKNYVADHAGTSAVYADVSRTSKAFRKSMGLSVSQ